MTSPSLLLPVRVPELGPSFGKLITGTSRLGARIPLDALRFELVTEIIEHAGEARRLATNHERDAALAALGRDEWLAAWERTVDHAAKMLVDRLATHIEAEAQAVGMPTTLRERVALDPTERRALSARIGSAGAALIPALDAVEEAAARARTATGRERDAMDQWQAALCAAARRLETAWLALEDAVDRELDHWLGVADAVASWRRPMWPVYVFGTMAIALAAWIGLMRGGVIATPAWVEALIAVVAG